MFKFQHVGTLALNSAVSPVCSGILCIYVILHQCIFPVLAELSFVNTELCNTKVYWNTADICTFRAYIS